MKKVLIFLLGIISFLGLNTVSAETVYRYDISIINSFENYTINEVKEFYSNNRDIISSLYSKLKTEYKKNYESSYPYYSFGINPTCESSDTVHNCSSIYAFFFIYKTPPVATYNDNADNKLFFNENYFSLSLSYNLTSNSYSSEIATDKESSGAVVMKYSAYMYSNFNLTVNTSRDYILFNTVPSIGNDLTLHNGDTVPTLNDLLQLDILSKPKPVYLEINLNDWSYVALSLKDYNKIPESNFSTYTEFYIKGQVCITPVYNYGLTERKDILTGTQIEGCGIYTSDFTLDRMYILRDDVKNHAIYYLKPFDKTKENIIKIDSNLFDITYINETNANNPQVEIEGKVYPTLPYDSLTDTSTKSEEEGYVPGATCSFGDFNCYNQYNPENLFDEVFSSPLELLKNVWSAITTVFNLIAEFISLLPVPMQTFLYLSFMIAVVLGLLKIIL